MQLNNPFLKQNPFKNTYAFSNQFNTSSSFSYTPSSSTSNINKWSYQDIFTTNRSDSKIQQLKAKNPFTSSSTALFLKSKLQDGFVKKQDDYLPNLESTNRQNNYFGRSGRTISGDINNYQFKGSNVRENPFYRKFLLKQEQKKSKDFEISNISHIQYNNMIPTSSKGSIQSELARFGPYNQTVKYGGVSYEAGDEAFQFENKNLKIKIPETYDKQYKYEKYDKSDKYEKSDRYNFDKQDFYQKQHPIELPSIPNVVTPQNNNIINTKSYYYNNQIQQIKNKPINNVSIPRQSNKFSSQYKPQPPQEEKFITKKISSQIEPTSVKIPGNEAPIFNDKNIPMSVMFRGREFHLIKLLNVRG